MKRPRVRCSRCGRYMKVEEWLVGFSEKPCPHPNRSHHCSCGQLWLSTDGLIVTKEGYVFLREADWT